jgi:hypothetical protein
MDVYVLSRADRTRTIILGVFQSAPIARAFAARGNKAGHLTWREPRPGKRFWYASDDKFEYFLEKHEVVPRDGRPPMARLDVEHDQEF